jgi:drug/metabolite transporter (DMT)-like permease
MLRMSIDASGNPPNSDDVASISHSADESPADTPRAGGHRKGVVALLLTAILWSTSGVAIKLIDWNPMAISGARSLIAFLFLLLVTRKYRLPKTRYDFTAALCYALTVISFVIANKLTTSANAIFLQYLSPAFTAIFGYWLLRERLEVRDWVLFVGMAAGMTLFFSERLDAGGFAGNVIAICSGMCMALFIVYSRKSAHDMTLSNMMSGHLIAAIVAVPFYFSGSFPSGAGLAFLFYLGIVQIGFTSILFAYGVRRFPALSTSMITLLEPVMNPVWVFLLVGEVPSTQAAIGGTIILAVIVSRSVWMQSVKE